jgi:predicted dehydrogenase
VGYHLRRSDTPRALRDAAAGGAIGDVVALDLRVGQHLSAWRPGSDPADTVTARAELGGGVLSELSHELDALRWLAGPVTEVRARLRFDGAPTDGRVETVAELDLVAGGVPAAVHLDMVADPPLRVWELRGVDGVLRADLLAGTVERLRPGRAPEVLHRSEPGERDRAGQRMVDHLLRVAQGAAPGCPVAEAAPTVAVVAAARTSHDLGGAPAAVAPVEVGFA